MTAVFGFKKRTVPGFDPAGKIPVIRSSICTGEKTAGYREGPGGKFTEVMLIRDNKDLREFLDAYGFREEDLTHEW